MELLRPTISSKTYVDGEEVTILFTADNLGAGNYRIVSYHPSGFPVDYKDISIGG